MRKWLHWPAIVLLIVFSMWQWHDTHAALHDQADRQEVEIMRLRLDLAKTRLEMAIEQDRRFPVVINPRVVELPLPKTLNPSTVDLKTTLYSNALMSLEDMNKMAKLLQQQAEANSLPLTKGGEQK